MIMKDFLSLVPLFPFAFFARLFFPLAFSWVATFVAPNVQFVRKVGVQSGDVDNGRRQVAGGCHFVC